MYCLRCGREIPDGELFCRECAKAPIERQSQPEKHIQPARQSDTARLAAPPQEMPAMPQPRRRVNRLLAPLIAACLVIAALGAYVVYSHRQIGIQKANYRVKEANLMLRENELSGLEENYAAALAELEAANGTIAARDEEIAALEAELRARESEASQSEYDAAAAQKTIDTLTEENETLTAENEALETEKTELQTALDEKTAAAVAIQEKLDEMTALYSGVRAKADFMDSYVVFVNNNGTGYYHRYDCGNFTRSNFWAYSRKLAENYGYTPCPVCGG